MPMNNGLVQRNTRNRKPVRRKPIHMEDTPKLYSCLINITREQVQAFGRGDQTIFNPGDIGKAVNRRAIQFIRAPVALKMRHNKRAFLRAISIKDGKALFALADSLRKSGVSEPFFAALGRMFPKFAVKNDLDVRREQRTLENLQKQVQKVLGEKPDPTWSAQKLKAILQDVTLAYSEPDDVASYAEPDDDGMPEEAATPNVVGEDFDFGANEDEEPEQDEPTGLEDLRQEAQSSGAVERAAKIKKLAQMGVKVHGNTKDETLDKLLARAIAKRAAS